MISTTIISALKLFPGAALTQAAKSGVSTALDQLLSLIDEHLGENNFIRPMIDDLKNNPDSEALQTILESSIQAKKLDQNSSICQAAERLNTALAQYNQNTSHHQGSVTGNAEGQGAMGVVMNSQITQNFGKLS